MRPLQEVFSCKGLFIFLLEIYSASTENKKGEKNYVQQM